MRTRSLTLLAVLLLLIPGACALQNASETHGAGNGSAADEDAGVCTVCMQHRQQPTPITEPIKAEIHVGNASAGHRQDAALKEQEHRRVQTHVRAVIAAQQEAQARELENMSAAEQKVYRNQNRVRLAVSAFLSLEEGEGGIGGNVSAIARGFNDSVQATIRAEEQIHSRSGLVRFFAGGDEQAAGTLAAEAQDNGERIRELNRLVGECDCDEETKAMLTQQVRSMEEEMARLQALARNETESKGMLGWLWK